MQITRGVSGAASGVLQRQHRHATVVPPSAGWPCRKAEAAAGVCPVAAVQWQLPRAFRSALVAAAATAGEPGSSVAAAADADAEVGIHEVEELRGIRANLDSQDPVVEYRVHWKDGSPDTWCVIRRPLPPALCARYSVCVPISAPDAAGSLPAICLLTWCAILMSAGGQQPRRCGSVLEDVFVCAVDPACATRSCSAARTCGQRQRHASHLEWLPVVGFSAFV